MTTLTTHRRSRYASFEGESFHDLPPGGMPQIPAIAVLLLQPPNEPSSWGDHVRRGIGLGIESLAAGLVVKIVELSIQAIAEKWSQSSGNKPIESAKQGAEIQAVKVAILANNCADLFGSDGRMKEIVSYFLHSAKTEEPELYYPYLNAVVKCALEHGAPKNGNSTVAERKQDSEQNNRPRGALSSHNFGAVTR